MIEIIADILFGWLVVGFFYIAVAVVFTCIALMFPIRDGGTGKMPHGFKSEERTCRGCGCLFLHYVNFDADTGFCGGCHDKPCPTCTGKLNWMIVQGEKTLWCQSCGAFDVFKDVKPLVEV